MMTPGQHGKLQGMARVYRAANAQWKQCFLECGKEIAQHKPYFYTDDIVYLCRQRHPNASTHDYRAIGPLMRQMARLGYCEKTRQWFPSTQPQNHSRDMRVWWSLLYQGPRVRKPRRQRPLDPRQLGFSFAISNVTVENEQSL